MGKYRLWIDTETYSEADLKKVGTYAYAEHPSTEIMICTYAFDDDKVQVWDATDGSRMPRDLRRGLRDAIAGNCVIIGQNILLFDRLLMRECWGYDIPPANIEDTMIMAFRHALPGSLEALCTVLGVDEQNAKDKAGKALINRFCKPTPKSYKVRRYTAATHPDEWEKFIKYARSDILSMREVYYRMPAWGNTEKENEILVLDQLINDRGFCVDVDLAKAAIEAVTRHKQELQAEAAKEYGSGLTGATFLPTLRDLAPAHEILNAQKSTLNDLLADPDLPDEARELIEMRLGAASTASTKYAPLLLGLSRDGRRRGCLQYGGAKRTLRWAGKGFQPQNLARGYYADEELDKGIAALLKGRAHRRFDVSKLAATTVRSCIVPEKGKKFVVADYSNVEGRGLAWVAGEQTALDVFTAGRDIYCETAGKMFRLDPGFIKENRKDLRQIGKACLHRHTQVLTASGFKDIMAVTSNDCVWNGEKWVTTSGAKLMGWKPVIYLDGVPMTADHQILANSWQAASELASDSAMLRQAKAIGSVGWSSFVNYQNAAGTGCYSRNAIAGLCRGECSLTTCATERPRSVTHVPCSPRNAIASNSIATATQCATANTGRDFSTAYLPQLHGRQGQTPKDMKTMEAVVSGCVTRGNTTNARFLSTFKLWKAGIIPTSKWIASIPTATMNLGIFGLSAVRRTAVTAEACPAFKNATMTPLPGLMNLNGKLQYCEPVYDLTNVNHGNRFLIKSSTGYLIAHNCELGLGYGGGVAAFLQFAKNLGLDLYQMAQDMDGTFPDHIWAAARRGFEFARIQEKNKRAPKGKKADRPSYDLPRKVWMTCDAIKRMWRESHPETVAFWQDLEDAAQAAIKNPGRAFWAGARVRENGDRAVKITRTFTRDENGDKVPGWWLKVELPSGRVLSYPGVGLSVEIEVDEETGKKNKRVRIKYQGENQTTRQWGWQFTYGGKLAENIVQALCRDLLAWSMPVVEAAGYPIILSVHDELITETPDDDRYNVAELEEAMCHLPSWARGFPLAAEGDIMYRYRK